MLNNITKGFLLLVGAAFINIAVQGLADPQLIMNMVQVDMGNNITARNSIRALYGGVDLAFGLFMIFGAFKMQREALILTFLFCAGFVFGRTLSIVMDGVPGSFAINWLVIESVLMVSSVVLLWKMTSSKTLTIA